MDLTEIGIVTIAKQYGPFIAFIAFVLWQNWRREAKSNARQSSMETLVQDTLIPMVEKTTGVIARNTIVMQRLEKLLFPRKRKPAARRKPV
jgi:hypothetical protein